MIVEELFDAEVQPWLTVDQQSGCRTYAVLCQRCESPDFKDGEGAERGQLRGRGAACGGADESMTNSANAAGLCLLLPVEPDVVPLPSRRMADGSIVFGLVEDRAPLYLAVVQRRPDSENP